MITQVELEKNLPGPGADSWPPVGAVKAGQNRLSLSPKSNQAVKCVCPPTSPHLTKHSQDQAEPLSHGLGARSESNLARWRSDVRACGQTRNSTRKAATAGTRRDFWIFNLSDRVGEGGLDQRQYLTNNDSERPFDGVEEDSRYRCLVI